MGEEKEGKKKKKYLIKWDDKKKRMFGWRENEENAEGRWGRGYGVFFEGKRKRKTFKQVFFLILKNFFY